MEWVASTLHNTSKHGISSIITADAHTSAASSWLNWGPFRFKWTRSFRRKTKSVFCACAFIFQTQSTAECSTNILNSVAGLSVMLPKGTSLKVNPLIWGWYSGTYAKSCSFKVPATPRLCGYLLLNTLTNSIETIHLEKLRVLHMSTNPNNNGNGKFFTFIAIPGHLSHINVVQSNRPVSLRFLLMLLYTLLLSLPKDPFLHVFQANLVWVCLSSISVTCPAHRMGLDLII
jgi:hypothetical protein